MGAEDRDGMLTDDALAAALERIEGAPCEVASVQGSDAPSLRIDAVGDEPHVVVSYRCAGERRKAIARVFDRPAEKTAEAVHRIRTSLEAFDPSDRAEPFSGGGVVGWAHPSRRLAIVFDGDRFAIIARLPAGVPFLDVLRAVAAEGVAREDDVAKSASVARVLVKLHAPAPLKSERLYVRGVRELLASVSAALDAFPAMKRGAIDGLRLASLERRFVAWRWRLKPRPDRLRVVHGGFEPTSVVVDGDRPEVLYGTGGGLGDPALDVTSMAAWLLFLGMRESVAWEDGIAPLWDAFWSTYMAESGDYELLDVAPPFVAARLVALASPLRSKVLPDAIRDALLTLAEKTLDAPTFDPDAARSAVR